MKDKNINIEEFIEEKTEPEEAKEKETIQTPIPLKEEKSKDKKIAKNSRKVLINYLGKLKPKLN